MVALTMKKLVSIALPWWIVLSAVVGESTNNRHSIRGLLDSIISSSAQGEAVINVNGRANSGSDSAEIGLHRNIINSRALRTNGSSDPSESVRSSASDEQADSPDYSGEIPDSVLVAQNPDLLIKTRLIKEREGEKSHKDAKELRKAQVKNVLLSKLRLDHLPSPRLTDFFKRYPHHLLESIDNSRLQMDAPKKEDNYHAKIQQMIRFSQQGTVGLVYLSVCFLSLD